QPSNTLRMRKARISGSDTRAVRPVAAAPGPGWRMTYRLTFTPVGCFTVTAHADNKQGIRPQMQRRTDGSELPQGAITEEFIINAHSRKDGGYRRGRHQMLQPQTGRYAGSTIAVPPCQVRMPLKKADRLPRGISHGRNCNG